MGHIFFELWTYHGGFSGHGAGEYGMSSQIGYKDIVLLLHIFRRPTPKSVSQPHWVFGCRGKPRSDWTYFICVPPSFGGSA